MVWASSASEEDRFRALGELLDCFGFNERKQVNNKVNVVWKRKIRKENKAKTQQKLQHKKNTAVPVSSKDVPVSAVAVPQRGWWCKYQKADIVSLDCEFVELHEPHQLTGLKTIAAEVSICDFNKKIIYTKKIRHLKGTFKDNVMANYRSRDGIDGSDFRSVQSQVHNLIADKLIVTVAGAGDFAALDLPISNYDVFDLHWFFKKQSNQFDRKTGETIYQPIRLKSLFSHYISKNTGIQTQDNFSRLHQCEENKNSFSV